MIPESNNFTTVSNRIVIIEQLVSFKQVPYPDILLRVRDAEDIPECSDHIPTHGATSDRDLFGGDAYETFTEEVDERNDFIR